MITNFPLLLYSLIKGGGINKIKTMIIKRKLYSQVEEEKMYARGTGAAVYYAEKMMKNKGNKIANKAANRISNIELGRKMFEDARAKDGINNWAENKKLFDFDLNHVIRTDKHSLNDIYLMHGKDYRQRPLHPVYAREIPAVVRNMKYKEPGKIKKK